MFGHHNYVAGSMTSEEIIIDGKHGYLFTSKCSCCGHVRRDILFKKTYETIDNIEDMG
jgi:hypothetical protein